MVCSKNIWIQHCSGPVWEGDNQIFFKGVRNHRSGDCLKRGVQYPLRANDSPAPLSSLEH